MATRDNGASSGQTGQYTDSVSESEGNRGKTCLPPVETALGESKNKV